MTYRVMGYATQQRDENVAGTSEQQQTTAPIETVIYETEDLEEAKKILGAGGFVNEDDVWMVATEVKFDPIEATVKDVAPESDPVAGDAPRKSES